MHIEPIMNTGALIGVLVGLITAIVKGSKAIHKFDLFIGDFMGTPSRPGVPARPGVMERLESIERRVADSVPGMIVVDHEGHIQGHFTPTQEGESDGRRR